MIHACSSWLCFVCLVAGLYRNNIMHDSISFVQELLANVAPKKANWDLKRDVAAKLEKLERRTQRALVGIMQEEEAQRFQEDGIQD